MSRRQNSISPEDYDKPQGDHVTPGEGVVDRAVMPVSEDEQGENAEGSGGVAQEESDGDQAHDDGGEEEAQQQRVVRDPGQPTQAVVD